MPHAILTPDGQLRQVVPKLLPTLRLEPGERIAAWNPPAADPDLQTVTPVLPVPADAQAVQFVVAARPLEVVLPIAKARKWEQIKAARAAAEFGGFSWDGSPFDSDDVSQRRLQGALQLAQLAGPTFQLDWTLADNTVRTLTTADLAAVGVALGTHVATCHETARQLRLAINAAQTLQEVDLVGWVG